jgi:glycosyltransferase involved in cell wall biosynthesis
LSPFKAVHIIGSRRSGGAERFFVRLVRGMVEAGVQTSIISRAGSYVGQELDRQLGQRLQQYTVPMLNVRDPWSRLRITRILGSIEPQVVQTYMGRATRLTRVPDPVGTVHVSRLGGFYKLSGYRHAHAWVGNTIEIRDYLLENGFPRDKVFYIRNFVDPEPAATEETKSRIREELGVPDDAFVIVSAGRFVPKKGFDLLLESFSRIPDRAGDRPVHLVLAGAGVQENVLKKISSDLGIESRVHWAGWLEQPGPYYELGDLFVCPSHHEPLGNVILEAWNHGVPVLSTASQGARELIQDGVNGVLVPCGDSDAMSVAMKRFLDHPAEFSHLPEEGNRSLDASYRSEVIVTEYIQMYRQLLAGS